MMLTAKRKAPDAVTAARADVDRAETELAELQKEHEAFMAERSRVEKEWKALPASRGAGKVMFGAYPTPAAGNARARERRRLEDGIRSAEERLRLRQERLRAVEKMAKPLSAAARARLEELVGWAVADAELAERLGANPCELMVGGETGKDRLLAFAREHGVEVPR